MANVFYNHEVDSSNSKLSRGKRVVERVGKGNIRGAHEPRDNRTAVASHADVLRGSSRQKTSAGEASTAGTWPRFCQMW